MSKKKEIQPASAIPGNINPNPELLPTLQELESSREIFKHFDFEGYLNSINSHFLGGKGVVSESKSEISSGVEDFEKQGEMENFELKDAWAGTYASLTWQREAESQNEIYIELYHTRKHDYYQLYLSAYESNDESSEKITSTGESVFRMLRLNPETVYLDDVDEILLAFTEELTKTGVLR